MEKLTDIRWFDTVESTNDEARKAVGELDNLSVMAACCQTAGRGQGDHKWHSRPGENLTFSVVLKFGDGGLAPLAARDMLVITEAVTLALRRYLLRKRVSARIKWASVVAGQVPPAPGDVSRSQKETLGILKISDRIWCFKVFFMSEKQI